MAYIKITQPDAAEGKLRTLYTRFANPDGSVDEILKVHSENPDALEAHLTLYSQCMHRASSLTRVERELIAVHVSRLNGCEY